MYHPLRFTVALAGIPVEIRCRHAQNRRFFREYLTDVPAALTVAPSERDIAAIRARYLQIHADAEQSPAWFWENQALHWKLCEALLSRDILLLHASALSLDGRAVLFTADSGTGKSTHAALWRARFGERVEMINDDKPLLKLSGGRVLACGTPWNGKRRLSQNIAVPVRAIVELRRDSVTHVEPCPDAFKVLYLHALRCAEPALCRKILALEREMIERVPFYRLGCTMDPGAAEIALRGIERLEAEHAIRNETPKSERAARDEITETERGPEAT